MNHHGAIIGVFGGCHHSDGIVGTAIVLATTWPWRWAKAMQVATHVSGGFIYEDGYREIYEAREGKSWQGPIPISKVEAWVKRKPTKRRFTMYDMPVYLIDMGEAMRKKRQCDALLEVWIYSMKQLPRMGIRKWLPALPMKPTINEVVCSKAWTIILMPQVNVCRITGKHSADRVTPFDFEQAMKAITQKKRHEKADTSDAYSG